MSNSHLARKLWGRLGSIFFSPLNPSYSEFFIQFSIKINRRQKEAKRYLYSKLYYSTHPNASFSEERVICFQLKHCGRFERVQISLPVDDMQDALRNNHLRVRIDGLPYVSGITLVHGMKLVGPLEDPELSRISLLRQQRQAVREQVLESERQKKVALSHYPESLSIELTALCNLKCPHCSSHGMRHLHQHHNGRPEMSTSLLEHLAHEAFPHATAVSLVGRGEPTLASDNLWNTFTRLLVHYDLRMSCVTNGTRIIRRFNEALIPYVNELCVSIDGATKETYEYNRKGAKFESVLNNVRYYHELRTRSRLARRPQLSFSWTLKKNNIHELPAFVELVKEFDPDLISIRHMVIFQDRERSQSLLDYPYQTTNRYLREAYALLDKHKINHESPPLMLPITGAETDKATAGVESDRVLNEKECHAHNKQKKPREKVCNWMHRTGLINSDGEVTTCGKHYGEQAGMLDENISFDEIWNGARMHSLREGFNTGRMWRQCRECWLREIKWHSQRQAKDNNLAFSLEEGMDFTDEAWDYRSYKEL
jgi:radical SAM protein with 4Fe4S-binding SPASM domain